MSRVGIVVVSHSPALARAAVDLALEMVPQDPAIVVVAAGTADGGTGTDAMRVADAITAAAAEGGGVLVFMDLGSAVLSAELALEFAELPTGGVRLTSAPFVEGLLAAVIAASAGLGLEQVEKEALGALGAKSGHLEVPSPTPPMPEMPTQADATAASVDVLVVNRDGLHARPAALVVAATAIRDADLTGENATRGGTPAPISGTTSLLSLGGRQGDTLRFRASGPDADALLDELERIFADGFGESLEKAATRARRTTPIGVSPGIAAGPVLRMPAPVSAPAPTPVIDTDERAHAACAISESAALVAAELHNRAARAGDDTRDILDASAEIVTDPEILDAARARVLQTGAPAAHAVWVEFSARAEKLRAQGGRIGERAADLHDAKLRLVAALTGQAPPGLPDSSEPYILVAPDLAPADTALLDRDMCLALVTEEGGPTSHTAIIARALGIPAVVGATGAWSAPQGTTLLVDGTTGELTWDPAPALVARSMAEQVSAADFDGHGATGDDHAVPLLANIGSGADARAAAEAQAEGVGLFRTEFLFLDRAEEPSIDEQVAAYRAAFAAFPGRRIVIRTLDAGSDKPLGFVTDPGEGNPALGIRGYRTAAVHPELLDRQLEAIARAASLESAEVSVMAPMIATMDEAAEFVANAQEHGIRRAGIMIETPSAALLADRLFEVVDFVSIGTNDLTQYTMAADRLVGGLAALNDPWQPAVLDLVARVGGAGAAAGKHVGVCGEAAADPLLAAALVGMGVTSLSMSSRAIAAVADRLRSSTFEQCREAARVAVRAASAADARLAARAVLTA